MKKFLKVLGLTLLSVAVVGCGSSQTKVEVSKENTQVTKAENEATHTQVSDGSDVTSQASQKAEGEERVIVGSVALVKILDALGVKMIGVPSTSYTLPDSVAEATAIGNPMSPDMEVMLSLEPTVIVALESLGEDYKTNFSSENIETLLVSLSSYEDLKETITLLGERFGKEKEAAHIIDEFTSREASILEKVAGKESPEVMIVFGAPGNFMIATTESYVGDLVSRVGGINIIDDTSSSFIPVNMEYLADKNPDIILTMSHASPEVMKAVFEEEFATNELWQHFDAVKEGNVVNLDSNYFGMSADLSALDAMEMLADILYE